MKNKNIKISTPTTDKTHEIFDQEFVITYSTEFPLTTMEFQYIEAAMHQPIVIGIGKALDAVRLHRNFCTCSK